MVPSLSFNEPDPNEGPYNIYALLFTLSLSWAKKTCVQEVHIALTNCFLLLILT